MAWSGRGAIIVDLGQSRAGVRPHPALCSQHAPLKKAFQGHLPRGEGGVYRTVGSHRWPPRPARAWHRLHNLQPCRLSCPSPCARPHQWSPKCGYEKDWDDYWSSGRLIQGHSKGWLQIKTSEPILDHQHSFPQLRTCEQCNHTPGKNWPRLHSTHPRSDTGIIWSFKERNLAPEKVECLAEWPRPPWSQLARWGCSCLGGNWAREYKTSKSSIDDFVPNDWEMPR